MLTQDRIQDSFFELQVAEVIKDDLWPNPLKYFNNVSVTNAFLIGHFSMFLTLWLSKLLLGVLRNSDSLFILGFTSILWHMC
jgi:hypothetical protein